MTALQNPQKSKSARLGRESRALLCLRIWANSAQRSGLTVAATPNLAVDVSPLEADICQHVVVQSSKLLFGAGPRSVVDGEVSSTQMGALPKSKIVDWINENT